MVKIYCDSCMREIRKGDESIDLLYRFSESGHITVELVPFDSDAEGEPELDMEESGDVVYHKQLHNDRSPYGCIQRAWADIIGEYNEYINKHNQPSEAMELSELPQEDNQRL